MTPKTWSIREKFDILISSKFLFQNTSIRKRKDTQQTLRENIFQTPLIKICIQNIQ